MAKTQTAHIVITANAKAAVDVMKMLKEQTDIYIKRLDALTQKKQQGVQLTKAEEKEAKELEKKIQALTTAQQKNQAEYRKTRDVMKNIAGSTTKDLKRAYAELAKMLNSTTGEQTKRQEILRKKMQEVKAQIDKNTGAINSMSKAQSGFGGALGTTLKNLVAYAGVFAGFNKAKSLIEGVFQSNLKLSDSLADIRKVSGLTMKDINQLYGNIAKIDTRNTIETLNELAYTGAKLGIAEHGGTQALTGFVKAAEQVQMALGEDLGDEALPALAKLTEVMGLMDRYGVEQAMQKAASSIFQLGATSTATGKNIVEFSKRLMGLANVSRVSADELLAIGSAADAMGLMPEVAATAFNKLFTAVQQKHNLIEKTLDLPKGRINYWFEQGKTMNAIVEIFDAMNKRGNMNALDGVFKDLGSDGARLVAVMTTMADRVDILKKHLDTSTKAFKEGEAVIGEYMIQNETANALMERASNLWAKAFTNPEGVTMVQTLAKEWYNLSKEMTNSQATMFSLKMTIEAVALALRTVISLAPFLIKAFAWGGVLSLVRGVGFGIAALVTQLRAATGAAMTLQVALKSNWVLAGVSAVLAGMTMLYEKSQAAAQAAEAARERQAELDKQLAQSKDTIDSVARPLERYKASLDKANYSEEQRNKLLREYLAGNYQDYLDYLGIEIDKTLDLAKAYNMVVKTMKQKKAYEERESYRTEVNGTNRMDRIAAGMEFEREAKRVGLEGVDRKWIEQNQAGNTMDIYMRLMRQRYGQDVKMFNYDRLKDVTKVHHSKKGALGTTQLYGDELGDVDLWNAIVHFQNSYRKERNLNRDVDDMFKDMVGDYDPDAWEKAILESQLKRKGGLTNEPTDDTDPAAAKKAAQEAKQALRKELDDAKKESDAIISKIEEWYRLQETVITGYAADGTWTQEKADQMIGQLNMAKNQMLADARRGISGRDEASWEKHKQQIGQLMFDTGDYSKKLLDEILNVRLENVRTALGHIDKQGKQYNLSSTALRDQMNKNAAGNEREIQRILRRAQQEIEKMLLQYNFLEQALQAFDTRLEKLGLLSESARVAAQRIQQTAGNDEEREEQERQVNQQRTKAKQSAALDFIAGGASSLSVNYENVDDLKAWLEQFISSYMEDPNYHEGIDRLHFKPWAETFREDFEQWVTDSNKYKQDIQAFYLSLVNAEDNYYKKRRESFNFEKQQLDQRNRVSGNTDQEEQTNSALEARSKMQDAGIGATFAQQIGLGSIENDPEVLMIQNRIHYRQLDVESAQKRLDQIIAMQDAEIAKMQEAGATKEEIEARQREMAQERMGAEDLLKDRQTALFDQETALATKVAQELRQRVQTINNLTKPIQDGAKNIGQKFGEMIRGVEEDSMTWNEIWRSMAQAVGDSIIDMMAQYAQNLIMEKMMNQQDKQEAMREPNVDVAAGLASAGAKTVGQLGWWGLALIPVIAAVLHGLLAAAFASNKESSSASNSSTSAPKMKLVSGMLTYDEGNADRVVSSKRRKLYDDGSVQVYDRPDAQSSPSGDRRGVYPGTDGHVYRATPQPTLPDGVQLIRKPIATTVNGQPSLVAERGPEIIIGRRATRHIQMNEPGLLHHLAAINGRYRTYDQGTVPAAASLAPSGTTTAGSVPVGSPDGESARVAAALEQNTQMMLAMQQTIAALSQTVTTLQQRGIPAHIQKYGSGGLIDEVKSGLKFDQRYNR